MSSERRRDVHRPTGIILAVFLLSSSIPIGQSRPRVEDSDAVPPAMTAFFRGTEQQPKKQNATESVWDVGRFAPAETDRGGRSRRTVLLAVGVGCGVVGAGLLVAGAVVYAVQGRKAGPGSGRRSLPEVRLGSPSPARSYGP